MTDAEDRVAILEERTRQLEKLVYGFASALMRIAGERDPHTRGHELRVAHLARSIALEMGLDHDSVEDISMAGLLYETGKLGVPEDVLANPGALSEVELAQMQLHPAKGSELLDEIEFPGQVADIVHQHHERLDGAGYPRGLKGDEIVLGARVLAVADVADAMMSDRPYRSAPGLGAAVEELQDHPEKYDPVVVAACITVLGRG